MQTVQHPDTEEQPGTGGPTKLAPERESVDARQITKDAQQAGKRRKSGNAPTVALAFRVAEDLGRDLMHRISVYAATNGRSKADVCIEALTQYLARAERGISARQYVDARHAEEGKA